MNLVKQQIINSNKLTAELKQINKELKAEMLAYEKELDKLLKGAK